MTRIVKSFQDLENQILVSSLNFDSKIINGGKALVKLKMNISTNNDNISEIQYPIPLSIVHRPIFLSATYKGQEKFADIRSSDFSKLKIDDEVAKGNFSIFLDQKNKNTTILVLTNFNKDINNVLITVELEALLPMDDENLYFEVPLVDNYKRSLNPDYKIFFEILSQEVKINEIRLQYNGEDHTHEIGDKTKIEASNVSLKHNLCLKMPLKRIKPQNHVSFYAIPNLILFIDDNYFKYQYFQISIINFIQNYGSVFRFNIIRYGNRSDILSQKMVDKTSDSPNQIRLFFEKSLQNSNKSTFSEVYTRIFGRSYDVPQYYADSFQTAKKNKEIMIKDVSFTNSAVICFGSHKSDQKILSRKVPTFLVDLAQNHSTRSFAIKNGFQYIHPMINSKSEFQTSLDQISQKLRTVEEEEVNPDQIFKEKVTNILRESDRTIDGFEMFVAELKSNGLLQNLTYGRLNIIMNEIEENELIAFYNIPYYLDQISLSDNYDYNFLIDLLNEKNDLFHLICRFVMVRLFGKGVDLPFQLSSVFKVICDPKMTMKDKCHFLLSYSSDQFVHFETEQENFSEIQYISEPSYSSEVEESTVEIPLLLQDDDSEEKINLRIQQKPENERIENVHKNQEVQTKNNSQTEKEKELEKLKKELAELERIFEIRKKVFDEESARLNSEYGKKYENDSTHKKNKKTIEETKKEIKSMKQLYNLRYQYIEKINNLLACFNGNQNQSPDKTINGNLGFKIDEQRRSSPPFINTKPSQNESQAKLIFDQISSLRKDLNNVNNQIVLIKIRSKSTYSEESKKILIHKIKDGLDEVKKFCTNAKEKIKATGNSFLQGPLERINSLYENASNNFENISESDENINALFEILGIIENINQLRNLYHLYLFDDEEQETDNNNQSATNNILNRNNLPDDIENKDNIEADNAKVISDTKTKFVT